MFAPGDKVTCVNPRSWEGLITEGQVYTVARTQGELISLHEVNYAGPWFAITRFRGGQPIEPLANDMIADYRAATS